MIVMAKVIDEYATVVNSEFKLSGFFFFRTIYAQDWHTELDVKITVSWFVAQYSLLNKY
jgi:hypothetical protein